MTWIDTLSVIGVAIACFAVLAIGHRFRPVDFVKVKFLSLEMKSWRIALDLERELREIHEEYSWSIDDWSGSGRMTEAISQVRARYFEECNAAVHEAKVGLLKIHEEAVEFGLGNRIEKLLRTMEAEFPALKFVN